jgi:SLOG cluster2
LTREQYEKQKIELGLFGEIICLDPDGNVIDWGKDRSDSAEPVLDADLRQKSLSALRKHMASTENGRVLIGGKRVGFQGSMPGVLEEALCSVERGQPLYLAGGFGGVTADIIKTLAIDDGTWLPSPPDGSIPNAQLLTGLEKLAELVKSIGWVVQGRELPACSHA